MKCVKCGNEMEGAICASCGYKLEEAEGASFLFSFQESIMNREVKEKRQRKVTQISKEAQAPRTTKKSGMKAAAVASSVQADQVAVGMIIDLEDKPYRVLSVEKIKPGLGAAFVRIKLHNIIQSSLWDSEVRTFRPSDKLTLARIDRKDMQYLFEDNGLYTFMDLETYEQISLNRETFADSLKFVKENEICKICFYKNRIFAVEPPLFVELEVVAVDNSVLNVTKSAVVETGATVIVPMFLEVGERIKVDTRTGEYLGRV